MIILVIITITLAIIIIVIAVAILKLISFIERGRHGGREVAEHRPLREGALVGDEVVDHLVGAEHMISSSSSIMIIIIIVSSSSSNYV